jgi:transcriptional regulator GlxA family with amidase domain
MSLAFTFLIFELIHCTIPLRIFSPNRFAVPLSSYDTEQIAFVKALIDTDISSHYTIEELSLRAALGKTKLKAGFKALYQKGIYTYLRELRMQTAAALVTDTDKTLKEIALLTGFKHYHNFLAAFTKHHGYTPGHARKNHGK